MYVYISLSICMCVYIYMYTHMYIIIQLKWQWNLKWLKMSHQHNTCPYCFNKFVLFLMLRQNLSFSSLSLGTESRNCSSHSACSQYQTGWMTYWVRVSYCRSFTSFLGSHCCWMNLFYLTGKMNLVYCMNISYWHSLAVQQFPLLGT